MEDLKRDYDIKRHILMIAIVAIILFLFFIFFPLILDLFFNDASYSQEPSERLNDGLNLILILIKKEN